MSFDLKREKKKQEKLPWDRSHFAGYSSMVGHFQVRSVLENARLGSLLDLACGDGKLTAELAKKFKRVLGVDASGVHLRKAQKRCPSAEFHESLIETFATEEKFDTVTMLNIMEHVADPTSVLKKAASFLKKDGVLIVHVPNALAVNRVIARIMGTLKDEYELSPFDIQVAGHRRSYDRKLLIKEVRRAGLKPVKTGGIMYKALSMAQMDWFLKKGLWQKGGFGWGRVGGPKKDWRLEFCLACYEFGKMRPDDCNIIYVVAKRT